MRLLKTIVLSLLTAQLSYAVGTINFSIEDINKKASGSLIKMGEKITVNFVADAANGSVPNLTMDMRGFITKVVTNPGSPAPTALYDLALTSSEDTNFDILEGALADRSATATEQVYPIIPGAGVPVYAYRLHTLKITNNSVDSAAGTIVFYILYQ